MRKTLDEYMAMIFDEMFTKKAGRLRMLDMAYQNSFVEGLVNFVEKGEFASGKGNGLQALAHESTCSCHMHGREQNLEFEGEQILAEIVMSPRIDKTAKRPVVMKYLRKVYQMAKARSNTGNDKIREHYRLLVLKLNYLFD